MCAGCALNIQEEDLSEMPASGALCAADGAAAPRLRAGAQMQEGGGQAEGGRRGRQWAFILSTSTVLIRRLITRGNGAPGEKGRVVWEQGGVQTQK